MDCDCEADCEREKLARRARGWFNLVRARRHTAAVECAHVRARSRGCGSRLVCEERRAMREIVKCLFGMVAQDSLGAGLLDDE